MTVGPNSYGAESSEATETMLPCPSCGEKDVDATYVLGKKKDGTRYHAAGCMVCGMTGPESHTPRDSADRWNALPRRIDGPNTPQWEKVTSPIGYCVTCEPGKPVFFYREGAWFKLDTPLFATNDRQEKA